MLIIDICDLFATFLQAGSQDLPEIEIAINPPPPPQLYPTQPTEFIVAQFLLRVS